MNKKVLSTILAATMLISPQVLSMRALAADIPESTGKIEFWNDKLSAKDASLIDELTESASVSSGIDVEFVSYPDVASFRTALSQSINTADAPGMFTWWSGIDLQDLYESGVLEDLTDLWNEYFIPAGVPENVAASLSFDGKYYAAPYSIIYNSMIYDKDTFAKYDLEVPTTYDEFLDVCQTLADNGVTPMAVDADNGLWGFKYFQTMLAINDISLFDGICDGSIAFTDERVQAVVDEWQELYDKGYFSIPLEGDDICKAMINGEIAMRYNMDAEAKNQEEDYDENLGVFIIPAKDDAKEVVFFEIAPLCVAANSADKGSAYEVLKNWYSQENQEVFTKVSGYHCVTTVSDDSECVNEMMAFAADTENYDLRLRFYENMYNTEVRDVAVEQFLKFEMGDTSGEEMLATIQAKADEMAAK